MKLGVIADTHIPDRYQRLPDSVSRQLGQVDMIVHAGDFISLAFYNELKAMKPLKAVLGNMDSPELQNILNTREVFNINRFKIGLMHGFGAPSKVLENVKKTFDDKFDLVIFGHTHNACQERIGATIFFNPGSVTDKIFAPYNSFGIIEIKESIRTNIIRIKDG